MSKHLVIVESPTKAKTISKFLSSEYEIVSSIGHIRDLPRSASDIPKKYKDLSWSRLGVDIENNFSPLYVTVQGKTKLMREIKQKLKDSDTLILATDEDREGESIAWHITELLKPTIPVKRMVFHEITKTAIKKALETYRELNMNLVRAQETRRIIDRLYGYRLSELIWKKITYRLSAGRVQSPSLRLIVEKEYLRSLFKAVKYHDISVKLLHNDGVLLAKLLLIDNKKIASGADFNLDGTLEKDVAHLSQQDCENIITQINGKQLTITKIENKTQNIQPPIPYTTSTLQQDANRKLKLTARETMRTAQTLYEQGYITYMRTDSPNLSTQAVNAAKKSILQKFNDSYLYNGVRQFFKKSKNAQEAHEAIRPAGDEFQTPQETNLTGREFSVYHLIWQRTLASQMAVAVKNIQTITLQVKNYTFTSTGSVITFPGFLALSADNNSEEALLPSGLEKGMNLTIKETNTHEHITKPPARYNDASLVKQLEQLGIGRPSTYATIINTLIERKYVRRVDQALVPTLTGFSVTQFLGKNFTEYIDYDFTATLEDKLDEIAIGSENYIDYLTSFYLSKNGLSYKVEQGINIDKEESKNITIPNLPKEYTIQVGRYGPYVIIEENEKEEHISIPEDCNPSDITPEYIYELVKIKRKSQEALGIDEKTGQNIYCLTGKYGPYVQLGELTEENPKPRRAQVPKTMNATNISLSIAKKLLSIPKILGKDPESGDDIIALIGRFGPYLKCGNKNRTLTKDDDIYTITLERAIERLKEEVKSRRGSKILKDLGTIDPEKKIKVAIYDGPYGPYLKLGTNKNIKLPDEQKDLKVIEKLTLKDVEILIKDV